MSFKYAEFFCTPCDFRFEYLAAAEEYAALEFMLCEACGEPAERVISAPLPKTVNERNGDFAERQKERLDKRADAHWKAKGKDEGADRMKAQLKRYVDS